MAKTTVLGGLTRKNPSGKDKSFGCDGHPSVNADATRSKPAATPKSLGPRTA